MRLGAYALSEGFGREDTERARGVVWFCWLSPDSVITGPGLLHTRRLVALVDR